MPLVEVDEFLARARSRGPDEMRRGEFLSHESADLDVKFLLAIAARDHPLTHVACVPDFVVCGTMDPTFSIYHRRRQCGRDSVMRIRGGIVITNLEDGEAARLWMPPKFLADLEACRRRGKRFVVANLGLYKGSQFRTGHSNGLTFSLRDRVVERWEPGGRRRYDATVRHLLLARLPGWTYAGTAAVPRALQTKATDAYDGMCVTFTLMYVLLRLANPDASARAVHRHLVDTYTTDQLRDRMLRLNRHVADTLRTHVRGSLSPRRVARRWSRRRSNHRSNQRSKPHSHVRRSMV